MRIAGKKIEGPNVEVIIIPRGEGENIILKAEAILDYDEFEQLCSRPVAPTITLRGGERRADVDDPIFQERLSQYGSKRIAWMCVKSLQATPDLEFEKVKLNDPETWLNLDDEFKEAGFSMIEIGRIRQGVFAANCLDESRLEEARQSFLASQVEGRNKLLSQNTAQNGLPSGTLASVSAFDPKA